MQKKQTVSRPAIISARRWMTAGLAVSVVGTQVANGTGPGSVAVGLLPVAFLAILATVEEGLAIASPLIAKLVLGKSPAKLLVATDAVEAVLAGAAVLVLFTAPRYAGLTLMFYLLAACACPVVSDLLEEFYGQQIAELDAHEAMTYNTHIYSLLSFISLVVAMPAGAWLAGISLRAALLVNFSLSAVAVCFRYFSSRTVLPGSFDDQEASEEFSLAGQREPLNQFLHDLIGAGPISPLISLINSFAAASSGVYISMVRPLAVFRFSFSWSFLEPCRVWCWCHIGAVARIA